MTTILFEVFVVMKQTTPIVFISFANTCQISMMSFLITCSQIFFHLPTNFQISIFVLTKTEIGKVLPDFMHFRSVYFWRFSLVFVSFVIILVKKFKLCLHFSVFVFKARKWRRQDKRWNLN